MAQRVALDLALPCALQGKHVHRTDIPGDSGRAAVPPMTHAPWRWAAMTQRAQLHPASAGRSEGGGRN